jgi:hypothetical protein
MSRLNTLLHNSGRLAESKEDYRNMEATMFTKKLLVIAGTAAALTATSAAFADYYYDSYGRYVYYDRPVAVERYRTYSSPPVYYSAPAYTYAPAPTYYYSPAPTYYYGPGPNTVGGAVAGALIGGALADRDHRGAGIAAGALIGGAIGSSYDYRYSY